MQGVRGAAASDRVDQEVYGSPFPTAHPTAHPTADPAANPTANLTAIPTATPATRLTANPDAHPTAVPTAFPTANPTLNRLPIRPRSLHPTRRPPGTRISNAVAPLFPFFSRSRALRSAATVRVSFGLFARAFPRSLADFGQITTGCGNGQCDPRPETPSSRCVSCVLVCCFPPPSSPPRCMPIMRCVSPKQFFFAVRPEHRAVQDFRSGWTPCRQRRRRRRC